MLVISRRKGQRISIGDDVELVITEIHKSSVRVGIVAPREQTVLRGEVRDSILAANRQAAASSIEDAAALAASLNQTASEISTAKGLPLGRRTADAAPSQADDAHETSRPTQGAVE